MADNSPSSAEIETPGEERSARWNRIDQIFQQSIQLPEDERANYVDQQCGSDDALRQEVLEWLESDRQACQEAFLEGPELRNADGTREIVEEAHAFIGKQLGPYTIVERIAAGAMGIVYRGRRTEGFQQQVAIKVLRPWLCDHENIARFRAEQQALADLPHPNIARLIDAGITEDGSHYLILEFIDGHRLDEAVAAMQPPLEIKLHWFMAICRAVAFAHDRGIAHRDLKPANILLTPAPQAPQGPVSKATERALEEGTSSASLSPKITDFGLAKITGDHGHDLTATGEILGTPGYMAPEQIQGMNKGSGIETDVYGLGALLYFLLTGRPPFRGGTITELIRELELRDPAPPAALAPGISADLNTICLKCLEKRPTDRYRSADELADDVQRYLGGFAVHARPIGWNGRLVRWSRRNRTTAALIGTLAATLIGSLVATTSLYLAAARGQREAEQERAAVLETIDRLLTEVSKSLQYQQGSQPVRQALLAAAKEAYDARVAARQGDDKQLQVDDATATYRLAQIHHQTLQRAECDRLARDAMAQFRQLAERYPDEHHFQFDIFHCCLLLGDYERAYAIISDLIRKYPLPDYREAAAGTACNLASVVQRDDPQRGEQLLRDGLALALALNQDFPDRPRFHRCLRHAYSGLCRLKLDRLDYLAALQSAEQAIAIGEKLVHDTPEETGFRTDLIADLGLAHVISVAMGKTDQDSEFLVRATAVAREGWQLHPQQLINWNNYIGALRQEIVQFRGPWQTPDQPFVDLVKEHRFALRAARHFWPHSEKRFDLRYAEFLADCPLEAMRDLEEAERLTSQWSAENISTEWVHSLGVVRLRCGRYKEAWECFRRAYPASDTPASIYAALAAARMGDLQMADRILADLGSLSEIQVNCRIRAEIDALRSEDGEA